MEIKVGGVYRTRGGERVEITHQVEGSGWPFRNEERFSWTKDGKYSAHDDIESHRDLIAPWHDEEPERVDSNREWMSESPTPEVGKWIGWNGGECPVHPETVVEVVGGFDGVWETSAHHRNVAWENVAAYRIIKEHVEPPKPREFWVVDGHAYDKRDEARLYGEQPTHVREVLGDD